MDGRALVLTLWAGCGGDPEPPPPPSPTLAVLVPLSGEGAARGQQALQAARAAAGERYAVLGVDDAGPASVDAVAARPEVVAALAHLTPQAVDRAAARWLETDLPVLTLSAGAEDRLPRAEASLPELGVCASALITGRRVAVIHDGSGRAMVVVGALQERLGRRAATLLALDPGDLSTDVGRLSRGRYDAIVYAGAPSLGGDLLRLSRAQGLRQPFVAVGGSAEELFVAAGADAGDARLIAADRAPFLADELSRLTTATGSAPSGVARDAYDAARLLVAAMDAVPRGETGLPARAEVRVAFEQVIGVGAGGPLALAGGRPTPIQCTAYAGLDGALRVAGAAQVGSDGEPRSLAIGGP